MSSNTEYPKICTYCGVKFIAKKISTKSCSHKCSQRAYKQMKKEERIAMAVTDIKNQGKPSLYNDEISVQNKPPDKNRPILIEREYLSVLETSQLMGVTRTTINKYCSTGKLKCMKMNRKIFIRRKDIDELFDSAPAYEITPRVLKPKKIDEMISAGVTLPQSSEPITEFITAKDAAIKFGVSKDAIHRRANAQKIPWVLFQRVRQYSSSHLEKLYKDEGTYSYITEWYLIDEIMEKYGMSKGGVYSLVSAHKVPRKNKNGCNVYSTTHIDELLKGRLGDVETESWYTTEELYEKYRLQSKYVSGFVHQCKIPRRRMNGISEYSQVHFDNALEEKKPPTVYLKIEDASEYFKLSPEKIYNLIKQHDLPKMKDDKYIRVQKIALERIINPIKLYNNGN